MQKQGEEILMDSLLGSYKNTFLHLLQSDWSLKHID